MLTSNTITSHATTHRGVLTSIRYQNDGFLIGTLSDRSAVKGPMIDAKIGREYTFVGHWDEHFRYGRHFAFEKASGTLPSGLAGIRVYLAQYAPCVGPEISKRLVEAYGDDALIVCKDDQERVARDIRGISTKRAEEIAATLRLHEKDEELEIALLDLLAPAGISYRVAARIKEAFGKKALDEIRSDPYGLARIRGMAFHSADRIARAVGVPIDGPERIGAGILHVLRTAASQEGHTSLPRENVIEETATLLELSEASIEENIAGEISNEEFVLTNSKLALTHLHLDETTIGARIKHLAGRSLPRGHPHYEGLADDQKDALAMVVDKPLSIVTGAPGTGKTFLLRRIADSFPDSSISLAAPTGKAARRMSDQTGRGAVTIHKLLEARMERGQFVFTRDRKNRVEADLIILDETSMTDVSLMARLLDAVDGRTRLVLIGDHHQLPSVGPGNVLRDLIESGVVPVTELTEIKRQDEGQIVRACHRIRDGRDIEVDNKGGSDLYFLRRDVPQEIHDTILDLVLHRLPARFGIDPLRDVQVITPLRKRTVLSCEALNRAFQRRLLPESDGRVRVGDKVIQTRNDPERKIINGDLGYVQKIEHGLIFVEFDGRPQPIEVPLKDNDLRLGYAVTIHKFQGSESPVVVIPIHRCFGPMMLQRNLLYTAVSRAQKLCVLVGQREQIPRIVARIGQQKRHTTLREMLH